MTLKDKQEAAFKLRYYLQDTVKPYMLCSVAMHLESLSWRDKVFCVSPSISLMMDQIY